MAENQTSRIVCPSCGRSYSYKPELAGRKAKCKCGGIIQVPVQEAPAADEPEPLRPEPVAPAPVAAGESSEDTGDEYDIREPAKIEKPTVKRSPQVLAYRGGAATDPSPAQGSRRAFPSIHRPSTDSAREAEEQSQVVKMVVVTAILAVVIVGAIFGLKFMHGSSTPAGPQLGEYGDIQAKMDDEYHKEIHDWFKEDNTRILGPWTQEQALVFANRWQKQGAENVIAFGSKMSLVVVIELPDDPAQRKQIFDWQTQWHAEHFQKVWKDVGQKYLMIRLGV